MVRKDVKIGAAVLAILIAVIVVYTLVVPSGPPVPAVNADDAFKRQMIEREANLGGGNQPIASNSPAIVKTETPTTPIANATPGPSVNPTEPQKKVDPFENEKWMMALNTGSVPKTSTADRGSTLNETVKSDVRPRSRDNSIAGNLPASLEPSTRPTGAGKNYTVATGDSIARIAENVYGSQAYYKVILEANPKVDPMKLRPGMVLVIPDVKETKGRGGHDDDSPAPVIESKAEYRVVAGDSLNKIAIKLYGKADRWEEIYDLNKDKIGTDPARLKLGMILKLPAPPTR